RLRTLYQRERLVVENAGGGTANDAGVVHAALAVDAERKLRDALIAARLRRISLATLELSHELCLPVRQRIRVARRQSRHRRGRPIDLLIGPGRRARKARMLLLRLFLFRRFQLGRWSYGHD